jgi:uncharacterized protein YfaQ (DUF2300 family)
VWKLFVHAWLVQTQGSEVPYRCPAGPAQRQADDVYCCEPGESVERDAALARSCGPYFEPARWGLKAAAWRQFWQAQAAPDWVQNLAAIQPGTPLAPAQLLDALAAVPPAAREAARQALLPVTLRDERLLAAVGSGPRFKTWSWRAADGRRQGGVAGWRADGEPFWLRGWDGTGQQVLHTAAQSLAPALAGTASSELRAESAMPEPPANTSNPGCVEVDFFSRYPLKAVRGPLAAVPPKSDSETENGRPAVPGLLRPGRYTLDFTNGQHLELNLPRAAAAPSGGELRLSIGPAGAPQLRGRFSLDDYVARVLDREGDARETAAARALAVAARSWLLANTQPGGSGCWAVADDSRAQRVSPQPASAAARAAAAFTTDLVLSGSSQPVRYHRDTPGPGVMAWTEAVQAGRAGLGFEAILRSAYPGAALSGPQAAADCEALPQALAWLRSREPRWRGRLRREAGYEAPGPALQICQLQQGVPQADSRRLRIQLREWHSREGRVSLIHEYLHLAFALHPHGQDERFVEHLAQQLVDLP